VLVRAAAVGDHAVTRRDVELVVVSAHVQHVVVPAAAPRGDELAADVGDWSRRVSLKKKALGFLLRYLSRKYRPCHIIKAFDRAFAEGTLKNLLQHIAAVQEEEALKSKRRGSRY